MGLLYQAVQAQQHMKRDNIAGLKTQEVLNQLQALKITHSHDGKSIEGMSYRELRFQLALAQIREEKT